MKILLFIISFFLASGATMAQSINFGSSTALEIGGQSTIYFEGGSTFDGFVNNKGTIVIEEDAAINGLIENSGTLLIEGNTDISVSAIYDNNRNATTGLEGGASLGGAISNRGDFVVGGDQTTILSGNFQNNGNLNLSTNFQINGLLDNISELGVLGDVDVNGTFNNPDGATTGIDGTALINMPFTNGGVFSVTGAVVFSQFFTNDNEANFGGLTTFEGTTLNSQKIITSANTTFNGDLTNSGEIFAISDAELDFVNNRNLGTLSFVDVDGNAPINEVVLLSSADSVFIDNLNLDTDGTITLPPNFVLVQTSLNILKGVLNATNQESFLVQGTVNVDNSTRSASPSYIEGTMLAITTDNETIFPMGIGGFPNYLTVRSDKPGVIIRVECKLPNPDSLFTDENTMGLASDVEWNVQTLSDSVEVVLAVDYSGVDFTNTPNFINAREYDATLQRYDETDTLFHALKTVESINNNTGTVVPDEGIIKTSDKIWVSSKATRLALGLSPVLTEPEVYLPNIFTPDAEMVENQLFRPFIGGAVVSSITFQIFDSFNREVYAESISGDDLDLEDLGWDGTLRSGLDAPEGVYYYKVNISYTISEEVSDKYFTNNERSQTQNFSKLGSVLLAK